MASGFGETASVEAQAQQQRMKQIADESGMRIIGPNSQGLANFASGAVLSFSTMFLEAPPQDGPVAIVSQSGGMSVVPYGLLRNRGIGVRHVHATGNDCDVSVGELASVLAEDPDLKLLLLYLETIRDADAVAQMALTYDPIIPHLEQVTKDWSAGIDHGVAWPARIVSAKHHAVEACWRIVDLAMEASGGGGMFKSNELERLFRDARCGRFHPANAALVHEIVGKTTLGIDLGEQPRWG